MDQSILITRDNALQLLSAPEPELDYLCSRIREGLARHEGLAQAAATSFVDCLENSIRIGWALADSFSLVGPGMTPGVHIRQSAYRRTWGTVLLLDWRLFRPIFRDQATRTR